MDFRWTPACSNEETTRKSREALRRNWCDGDERRGRSERNGGRGREKARRKARKCPRNIDTRCTVGVGTLAWPHTPRISLVGREFREVSEAYMTARIGTRGATAFLCLSLSVARTSTTLLARAAGKTRGKSTTGGTNILGVLTSQDGGNVSEEEGERVRVRPSTRARPREPRE